MGFISMKDAQEKWNMDLDNIEGLLENGYIPGAIFKDGAWNIPEDFTIPSASEDKTHYPMLELSEYISNPFLLNEEEKRLLFAGLDHVKGKFDSSIERCNQILKTSTNEYVKRGCYVTEALCYLAKGDLYGWKKSFSSLKYSDSKTKMDNKIKELLIVKLYSNLYFSETEEWITEGNFDDLPMDAFPDARNIYIFNRIKNAEDVDMADYRFLLSENKASGATMASVYTAILMASAYHYMGKIDKSTEYLDYVLSIALPKHWIMPLIQLRKSIGVLLDNEIRDRDEDFYKEYANLHKSFMENWNRIYEFYKGEYPTKDLNLREEEIMFYMINGKSNAEIADILCLSVETIKTNVKNIFQKTGVLKRNELKDYMEENS